MSPAAYLLALWTVEHWPLFVAAFMAGTVALAVGAAHLADEMEADR